MKETKCFLVYNLGYIGGIFGDVDTKRFLINFYLEILFTNTYFHLPGKAQSFQDSQDGRVLSDLNVR